MAGRQLWVEVAFPQQFLKQKMTLKNVQDCLLIDFSRYLEGWLVAVLKHAKTHQNQHNNHTR